MSDELLKVESLGVAYGESQIIGQLSLMAKKNEVLAVMGLNGMGKTTAHESAHWALTGARRKGDARRRKISPS